LIFCRLIKGQSYAEVRNKKINQANESLLAQGNLQDIATPEVLRRIKCEGKSSKKLHSDGLINLIMKLCDSELIHSFEVKPEKFGICIISNEQIFALKHYIGQCKDAKSIVRLYYDATGSIVGKPRDGFANIFHHVLVAPLRINSNDRNASLVNIAELITTSHTSDNLEIFLRKFIQIASKDIKSKGIIYIFIN
jgi:hypothetical protein